jgi:hypothetical protein
MDITSLRECTKTWTNVYLYSDLRDDITKYLHPKTKSCIILVLFTPKNGHYICVWGSGENLMLFDPFGNKEYFGPKNKLNGFLPLTREMLRATNQEGQILFESFIKSPYKKINFNDYTLQKCRSTCGGWSVLRLIHQDLSHKEFYKRFKDREIDALKICGIIENGDPQNYQDFV